MTSERDYYIDADGNLVMTASFHLKRGTCCGNGCRHCPFDFVGVEDAEIRRKLQLKHQNT